MGRRFGLLGLCAVLCAVAVPDVGVAGNAGPAFTPKQCVKPRIKPNEIVIACGDGNFFIEVKKYSFYNGREAGGTGEAFVNDCMPSCAEGDFGKYSVKFRLFKARPGTCGGRRVPYFHKIEVTWKGDRPSPSLDRTEKYSLLCVP